MMRPMTSSQSPNNARNATTTTYAMTTNSTRSGVPATAIGGSRIHPPPLQSTSFNHASSMPFSPMDENTTTSFLPSTTTNTRKHTKNKFQFTPTNTGQSI